MQDTMINRVLRVSPEQNELYRRNKSRIFIGVEGESLIDTILQQPQRPIEEYIDVAHRAIAQAGLDNSYGELRGMYGSQIGIFGATHLVTQNWLKDEDNNVYDLFISVDPDFEITGEPPVQILPTQSLENGLEGENPLVLSVDISDLIGPPMYDDANENSQMDDGQMQGGQGRVKDPNDGRLLENRQEGTHVDDGRQQSEPGAQGQVKNPNDGRLKENIEAGVHVDDTKAPAMAREGEPSDETQTKRGRVTSRFDRRLKTNRSMARRGTPTDDNDPPAGGGGQSGGGTAAAGGRGRTGQSGGGSGTKASANDNPTWADGRPRTIAAVKLDGTPRKKPGPQLGTKYKRAA